jgi:4-hydroxy-3-methylbut-2-enyl diphosphate reductase
MEIVLAKSAGFCFGVKRATQMAFEASAEYDHICSLGPIIHSPQVVRKLAEKGVAVVDEVSEIPKGGDHPFTGDGRRDAGHSGLPWSTPPAHS